MNIELPPIPSLFSRNVAVIGAGAAGLVAARELRLEGHKVVIFEREIRVGGTWVYNPATESDPIGVDPSRAVVSSSLYKSLRTNLPREVMGYRAYPFVASNKPSRDSRRYPGHREVLDYLTDFATEFGISDLVRFGTEVSYVGQVEDGKWNVKSRTGRENMDEIYDAVVICNGHYTEPRSADITGIEAWPGKQIHSHNYRVPEPYRGQVVVLIGSAASAVDISRDIAGVAKEVHIACRSLGNENPGKIAAHDNMWLHPMIKSVHEDGFVVFEDGTRVLADIILHCTGYKFHFPFLHTNGKVTVDDNRVGPLYKHVFPPSLAPWLSYVGLPWKVVPLPQFELQSKWISGVLSGRILLPANEEMMADIEAFYRGMEESGIPKRYTHNMANSQFEYNDWVAKQCGCPPSEEWRKQMYALASKNKNNRPESYRNEWDDDHLIPLAHEDFIMYGVFAHNS
ncbi:flavin-containing monooxygenase FMO GS-OX-like 4 isoform X2 [Impatiens glandulifera]|uniref:flavin-containing monooxygenase FMO GS-OX-like 4 isoform X2 n=1 Tax=Impatiens glandulifera TaxID=253017 RepID=UPI001FB18577|nr:flavin-containing monooxygenase FMO GS-OX-like 4 isoform X2 [Impatiens glandulifera]